MKTVTPKPGQTLWDIAVEHCGAADAAFEAAQLNGMPPTARISANAALLLPEQTNAKIARHYAAHGIVPATDVAAQYSGHQWSDPVCVSEPSHYGMEWNSPVCVQTDPYGFQWGDPVCVTVAGSYQRSWSDPVCVQKTQRYGFRWSDPVCAAECNDPYTFSWSNGVCAQYYDTTIEWEEF